jgi:hypothetical protein
MNPHVPKDCKKIDKFPWIFNNCKSTLHIHYSELLLLIFHNDPLFHHLIVIGFCLSYRLTSILPVDLFLLTFFVGNFPVKYVFSKNV